MKSDTAARSHSGLLLVLATAVAGCGDSRQEIGTASTQQARVAPAAAAPVTDTTDWKAVDRAMARTGKMQPGGVYKYSLPRGDLQVIVGGVTLKPALALGSWVAFKRVGAKTMAMGDLVLTEKEIAPVMGKLQEMGMEQTALHNHLLHESPGVMYMHIHAEGDPEKIAQAVHAALALTKTPPAKPAGAESGGALELDTAGIAQALGYSGTVNGGVYQVSVPRVEPVRAHGAEVPPSMGVATAINFQPTGGAKAAVTGDFVMMAQEVSPVLKALREAQIEVTALHNHMIDEEPRLFFAHFWAHGDALRLARGIHAGLEHMNVKKRGSSRLSQSGPP